MPAASDNAGAWNPLQKSNCSTGLAQREWNPYDTWTNPPALQNKIVQLSGLFRNHLQAAGRVTKMSWTRNKKDSYLGRTTWGWGPGRLCCLERKGERGPSEDVRELALLSFFFPFLSAKSNTHLGFKKKNKTKHSPENGHRENLLQYERKWKWVALSCQTLCDPMDCVVHQAPLSMECYRQEYWSG